ncbi:hypothetical protein D3C77_428830 [compost metagenome]
MERSLLRVIHITFLLKVFLMLCTFLYEFRELIVALQHMIRLALELIPFHVENPFRFTIH